MRGSESGCPCCGAWACRTPATRANALHAARGAFMLAAIALPEARMTASSRRLPAADLLDRLLDLWTDPSHADAVLLARFGSVYTDPVLINSVLVPLSELVDRARMISNGLGDVSREVIDVIEGPTGRVAFAFRIRGRHVGPLPTPLGP